VPYLKEAYHGEIDRERWGLTPHRDAVAAARDQHRVLAHLGLGREKVAGPWDLALVAQEQPAAGKDLLQFLFIDLLLDEDAAADEAAIGVDERVHVRRHQGSSNSRM
jgi:hypothetical protein